MRFGPVLSYADGEFALTHKFAIRRGAAGRRDERRSGRRDERYCECGFEESLRHTFTQSDRLPRNPTAGNGGAFRRVVQAAEMRY